MQKQQKVGHHHKRRGWTEWPLTIHHYSNSNTFSDADTSWEAAQWHWENCRSIARETPNSCAHSRQSPCMETEAQGDFLERGLQPPPLPTEPPSWCSLRSPNRLCSLPRKIWNDAPVTERHRKHSCCWPSPQQVVDYPLDKSPLWLDHLIPATQGICHHGLRSHNELRDHRDLKRLDATHPKLSLSVQNRRYSTILLRTQAPWCCWKIPKDGPPLDVRLYLQKPGTMASSSVKSQLYRKWSCREWLWRRPLGTRSKGTPDDQEDNAKKALYAACQIENILSAFQ